MPRALLVLAAAGFAVLAYVYVTLPDVRALATDNPTTTAFMEIRAREAAAEGRELRHLHRWAGYARISPNLKRAVLVAEDDAFWDHDGVDMVQIRRSIEVNLQRGAAVRGASTLTQQLAKNLYLSPSRDPLRKLRELIIARRLEAALSKARIFEIYLNVIEWGDGIWGADAAARAYFGVSAASLSASQAALLAAAIVNPRLLNPGKPTPRLLSRQRMILGRMRGVTPPVPAPVPATASPADSAADAADAVAADETAEDTADVAPVPAEEGTALLPEEASPQPAQPSPPPLPSDAPELAPPS